MGERLTKKTPWLGVPDCVGCLCAQPVTQIRMLLCKAMVYLCLDELLDIIFTNFCLQLG